jgi:hypothetical protein
MSNDDTNKQNENTPSTTSMDHLPSQNHPAEVLHISCTHSSHALVLVVIKIASSNKNELSEAHVGVMDVVVGAAGV